MNLDQYKQAKATISAIDGLEKEIKQRKESFDEMTGESGEFAGGLVLFDECTKASLSLNVTEGGDVAKFLKAIHEKTIIDLERELDKNKKYFESL